MRQRWIALLALIPVIGLGMWLVMAHLPTWSAAHAGWFPADHTALCPAVTSLRAHRAALAGDVPVSAVDARITAEAALNEVVGGALRVNDNPLAVRAVFEGETRPAWLFTAVDPAANDTQIAVIGLVYIDGETGAALEVNVGFEDPAARCDFNLRRAVRDTVLSPPFIVLVGYTGVWMAALVVRWLMRRIRIARKDG